MTPATLVLLGFAVVTVVLIATLIGRPALLRTLGGRAVAFVGFFLLPVLFMTGAAQTHMEQAKTTQFCLSCHVMEPWGKSLTVDDSDHLAAAHYQNSRVPREQACYTCHTTYTMFGGAKSKLAGLRHIYMYYIGGIPEKIELSQPYQNRECLHCHAGARSYEESDGHADDLADIASGKTSCLECHETVHDTESLADAKFWTEPQAGKENP
jgi:cytochrome c-type protein NapC